MSVKTIHLKHYTGKVTVYRSTGKGPVRYGDRYAVFLEGCPEISRGKHTLIADIANEGRNSWRITEQRQADVPKVVNTGYLGTLEQAATDAAAACIENARFRARQALDTGPTMP